MLSRSRHQECLRNGSNGQTKQDLAVQLQTSSTLQVSCQSHTTLRLWNMDPACWLKKRARLLKPSAWGSFSVSPSWSKKPTTGCGARSTLLWVHRNLLWQLSRDGNWQGLGMLHATTASPKPWSLGYAVVGRRNAGWITSNKDLLQKRLEEDLRSTVPHVPPTNKSVKGLNWTEHLRFSWGYQSVH